MPVSRAPRPCFPELFRSLRIQPPMSMNLGSHRWWVMALAVLLGAETATTIAEAKSKSPPVQTDDQTIAAAVKDLASPDPQTRDAASARLTAISHHARSALEQAAKSEDPEVTLRARSLLAKLEVPLALTLSTDLKPNRRARRSKLTTKQSPPPSRTSPAPTRKPATPPPRA